RQHDLPGEVNAFRLRPGQLEHAVVRANCQDAATLDCQRLSDMKLGVNRYDLAVMQNQVGRPFLGGQEGREEQENQQDPGGHRQTSFLSNYTGGNVMQVKETSFRL